MEIREVTKRFGEVLALDDVTLDVRRGECLALVGESGSGKTTLLRLFNRTVEADAGAVMIEGQPIQQLDPVELRRFTGFVQQEGGLLPHWNVLRNVELVPWLQESPKAREAATAALKSVGLPASTFGSRWPRELSGGQRQRVAIARAIAAEPEVVLLDEPFGALDAITRAELQRLFVRLLSELPLTVVLVTHDLREAVRVADRIAVMRAGRLEQVAPPDLLVSAPETAYVRDLLTNAGLIASSEGGSR